MSTSTNTTSSRVSLIDLTRQLPFEIDDELKADLKFVETLIVSCAHYEGEVPSEDDEDKEEERDKEDTSSWTCTATTSEPAEQPPPEPFEVKDYVEEAKPEEVPEEDDDFHFFFFQDCNKPLPPENSKQSLIMVDDMPQINPKLKDQNQLCTCDQDRRGVCECNMVLPCKCGAKGKKKECICGKLRKICICDEDKPNTVCTCHKNNDVCTCFPGPPRPVCVCEEIEKPCICKKGQFPSPVCECKFKPSFKPKLESTVTSLSVNEEWGEGEGGYGYLYPIPDEEHSGKTSATSAIGEGEGEGEDKNLYAYNRLNSKLLDASDYKKLEDVAEEQPCDCQKPKPKETCLCQKGKTCICKKDMCICGAQKTCVCTSSEGTEPVCKSDTTSSKIICECPIPKVCTCEAKGIECKCFPKRPYCTCGDPENCKCKNVCDCIEPCICDTQPQRPDECICLDKAQQLKTGLICTCPCKEKESKALKRIRAGKQGYRWCHDVDPYHTFFDYAYGRHDLIDYKEQEKEKFKILGLYDEKEDVCPVHGLKLPSFEKKVRKASLDCCSSVGGITISVETLGELQDKFLVQVVSHASKEGAITGSKLVSIIDINLHTLEENRTEYITKKNITKQRKSYMAICDNGYYNKVTRICGERHVARRLYHTFEKAKHFLLEGANVVLLRYFGLRRYKGVVSTETVLMDGTICESIYVCPGVSQAVVNGKPLFVNKVERHIIEPNGFVHQTLTVLSLRGYIISHEWADNSYVLHINPLLNVIPTQDLIEDHAPIREKWREDLQLFSDFLDFKTTRSHEGARYVAENGTLTSTVRDYLQAILLLKPHDVVHFTRHYFDSALSSMDLPRDEYFDPCQKHVRYFYLEE